MRGRSSVITGGLGLAIWAAMASGASAIPFVRIPERMWLDDYGRAMDLAKARHQMLVIFFRHDVEDSADAAFHKSIETDPVLRRRLGRCVLVEIPVSCRARIAGQERRLLAHEAFGELEELPGLALVDFTDPASPYYGYVVSVYPFEGDVPISAGELRVMLNLPTGSLTQRTLVFAVRTHPEHPHSTESTLNPILEEESEEQAAYQAAIQVQGHHHWGERFQRINARLAGGLLAREVCAESWPGQGLLDAARECVHSWRQSSGHWSAVSSRNVYYGYDMKRGRNGIWYATGIFAGGD
jgi:hypothetical protein